MVPVTSKDGNATQPTNASNILSSVTMNVMAVWTSVETPVWFPKQKQHPHSNIRARINASIALSFVMENVLREHLCVVIAVCPTVKSKAILFATAIVSLGTKDAMVNLSVLKAHLSVTAHVEKIQETLPSLSAMENVNEKPNLVMENVQRITLTAMESVEMKAFGNFVMVNVNAMMMLVMENVLRGSLTAMVDVEMKGTLEFVMENVFITTMLAMVNVVRGILHVMDIVGKKSNGNIAMENVFGKTSPAHLQAYSLQDQPHSTMKVLRCPAT